MALCFTMSPTGLFGLLPDELIVALASLLPMKDVLSLKSATDHLLPALDERTNPSVYLRQAGPFCDTDRLLEVMATHGAVLSGSRALEFFVPGSVSSASDWDFYVPPVLASVIAVKRALEQSGVHFETALSAAARRMTSESSVVLGRNQIMAVACEAHSQPSPASPASRRIVMAVHNTYPELREMGRHIRADGSVSWISGIEPVRIDSSGTVSPATAPEQEQTSYTHAAKVLCGSASKSGREVSVQLVVGAIDPRQIAVSEPVLQTVFRSIFLFYGSHVQCFLTKHVAFHMYYEMAANKSAYKWDVPRCIRPKAEAAVQKYAARGYEFQTAHDDRKGRTRAAMDADACLVVLDTKEHYLPALSMIQELRWCHQGRSIRPLLQYQTADARRNLLPFGILSRFFRW